MAYDFERFEADVQALEPRPFDTWVLPAFLIFYAIRSKREMGKLARRILFTSGVYMVYRSYARYKEAASLLLSMTGQVGQVGQGA